MLTQVSFFILGILTVFLSLVMITRKWPVSAAMLLVVIMIMLAGMYGLMGAHFSAVSQIIVYAGAIMVVFVFVIMLLNVPVQELSYGKMTAVEMLLSIMGVVAALFLGTRVGHGFLEGLQPQALKAAQAPYYPSEMNENAKNIAALMFTKYLWAFELISFLLLVSIIGAIVIAKKEPTDTQEKTSPSPV